MTFMLVRLFNLIFFLSISLSLFAQESLSLFYWQPKSYTNFGDYLSLKIVERMVGSKVDLSSEWKKGKLLAIGSILNKARDGDIIWGTGVKGERLNKKEHKYNYLDVRAVRGPLTRKFLVTNFNIDCPEIYGDPALLIPQLFPEFQKPSLPTHEYCIIPHYSEIDKFPKKKYSNVIYPTEPWDVVIRKILDSKFVISSSLHGIIVAEAFNIPARYLFTKNQHIFKYKDYYLGTGRPNFRYALSVKEALKMGGESPIQVDLQALYNAFPFEFWRSK